MAAAAIYGSGLGLLLVAMTGLWLLSVRLRNAGIVDAFWGMNFVLSGWFYFFAVGAGGDGEGGGEGSIRGLVVMILVTIWGLRLALYLLWRNHLQGSGAEDYRYQQFRRRYGPERYWWVSFFQVFMLQGTLAWLIGAPLLGAQLGSRPLGWLDALAVLVWIVGFSFEAGGDLQLALFKRRKRPGELLTAGFWRYTRHPNYFGDAACWWAYGLFSIAAGEPAWALGAALMTGLIVKVSGVALLERSLRKDKPGYAEYVRRTSAFIPWPPKRERSGGGS